MATLARDRTTYRAGGIRVRDARHVHNGPEISGQPAAPKNTRQWCRGKIGRAHAPVAGDEKSLGKLGYAFAKDWLLLYCSTCGKELGRWSPPMMVGVLSPDGTCVQKPIFDSPQPDWAREYLASRPASR